MKLEVDRFTIRIIPESPQDVAYIEEVLGLEDDDDAILLKRVNVRGAYCLAYVNSIPNIITSAKRIEEIADANAIEEEEEEGIDFKFLDLMSKVMLKLEETNFDAETAELLDEATDYLAAKIDGRVYRPEEEEESEELI